MLITYKTHCLCSFGNGPTRLFRLPCPDRQGFSGHVTGGSGGNAMMTPAPDAARFAGGGGGGGAADLDSLESRIWAHVKHVCSPSHKGRVSTLVKVCVQPSFHLFALMLAHTRSMPCSAWSWWRASCHQGFISAPEAAYSGCDTWRMFGSHGQTQGFV